MGSLGLRSFWWDGRGCSGEGNGLWGNSPLVGSLSLCPPPCSSVSKHFFFQLRFQCCCSWCVLHTLRHTPPRQNSCLFFWRDQQPFPLLVCCSRTAASLVSSLKMAHTHTHTPALARLFILRVRVHSRSTTFSAHGRRGHPLPPPPPLIYNIQSVGTYSRSGLASKVKPNTTAVQRNKKWSVGCSLSPSQHKRKHGSATVRSEREEEEEGYRPGRGFCHGIKRQGGGREILNRREFVKF